MATTLKKLIQDAPRMRGVTPVPNGPLIKKKGPFKGSTLKSGGTVKAKDGKWMQKAAASIKKRGTAGKCTPITKPGCTGKAKALAKTFKAIAKKNKK
jgi:hypothetical protein